MNCAAVDYLDHFTHVSSEVWFDSGIYVSDGYQEARQARVNEIS